MSNGPVLVLPVSTFDIVDTVPAEAEQPQDALILQKPVRSVLGTWLPRAAAVVCGTLFGFFLHKAGMFRAAVIVAQFTFADFRMLNVPLSRRHQRRDHHRDVRQRQQARGSEAEARH